MGYCLQAGRQAIGRWALTEAVAQLRRGLDLLTRVVNCTARQEHELNLQITLGNALIATKGYSAPEPGEAYARARQLCSNPRAHAPSQNNGARAVNLSKAFAYGYSRRNAGRIRQRARRYPMA